MADPFVQQQIPAQIAEASAISGQVDLGGYSLVGIVFPTNWSAAGLSFQASCDGGNTWGELLDDTATAISIGSVTGEAFVAIDPAAWRGVRSIKVRSGSKASPVAQPEAVTLTLLTRPIF
jgi:hypothetical protein